jgi:hypothetical protein
LRDSWRRCKQGLSEESGRRLNAEVQAARRNLEAETGDDRETQSRVATAASVVGAWMKGLASSLVAEIGGIDAAIAGLRLEWRDDRLHGCRSAGRFPLLAHSRR